MLHVNGRFVKSRETRQGWNTRRLYVPYWRNMAERKGQEDYSTSVAYTVSTLKCVMQQIV